MVVTRSKLPPSPGFSTRKSKPSDFVKPGFWTYEKTLKIFKWIEENESQQFLFGPPVKSQEVAIMVETFTAQENVTAEKIAKKIKLMISQFTSSHKWLQGQLSLPETKRSTKPLLLLLLLLLLTF